MRPGRSRRRRTVTRLPERGRRRRAPDDAGQRDDREHVRDHLDELRRDRPAPPAAGSGASRRPRTAGTRAATRFGSHRPKITAASAMKPRPAVMPSVNWCWSSARYAPPSPASTPRERDADHAHARHRHAERRRRLRLLADRAHAQPERRAVEQPRDARHRQRARSRRAGWQRARASRSPRSPPAARRRSPARAASSTSCRTRGAGRSACAPTASRLIAMPTTTWSALKRTARERVEQRQRERPPAQPAQQRRPTALPR